MWISISEHYEASTEGHIRNKRTKHILKEFAGKGRYLRTQFDGKTQTVHRVIAKAFLPVENGKDFVNHKDGHKENNSVENLEWCTRSENMEHAYKMGLKTSPIGEKNGRSKLTKKDVEFIRMNYKRGSKEYGEKALSVIFHVAPQTISTVVTGQHWTR